MFTMRFDLRRGVFDSQALREFVVGCSADVNTYSAVATGEELSR